MSGWFFLAPAGRDTSLGDLAAAAERAAEPIWSCARSIDSSGAVLGVCGGSAETGSGPVALGPWRVVGDCRIDDRAAVVGALGLDDFVGDDLELVARALDRYGTEVVRHISGEMSFCGWNSLERRAVVATDAFGTRPVFFSEGPGFFVAANSIEVVRATLPGPELDDAAVLDFLIFDEIMEKDRTVFRGIRRLPAGHLVSFRERAELTCAWQLLLPPIERRVAVDEHASRLRAALFAATSDRLGERSSLLLSGGMDSSAIAASAKAAGQQLHCINVELADPNDEDGRMARLVAGALSLPLERCLRKTSGELLAVTASTSPQPSFRPFAPDPDYLATAYERAPVLLHGEGGDEIWSVDPLPVMAGYQSLPILVYDVCRTLRWGAIPYLGTGLRAFPRLRRHPRYEPTAPTWISASLMPLARERAALGTAIYHRRIERDERARAVADLTGPMSYRLFEEHSEAGMGRPLAVRFPFFDQRVVDTALAMPVLPCALHKFALRRAFKDLLPREVLARRKFGSAGPPLARLAMERTWERSSGPAAEVWRRSERFRRYVDPESAGRALASGVDSQVWETLRAWSFSRWLARLEPGPGPRDP